MRKRIGGLILAAGCSKRMGDFKPLMPLRGKTLIENTIDSMLLCGISPITVVLGHRGRDIEAILKSRYLGTGPRGTRRRLPRRLSSQCPAPCRKAYPLSPFRRWRATVSTRR